ncbi:MAG: hypothetical protein JRC93_13335 [Deltaproteobacteria bacterium]|nr:hypothetical protein [Deltaproteobacteria bacterium]
MTSKVKKDIFERSTPLSKGEEPEKEKNETVNETRKEERMSNTTMSAVVLKEFKILLEAIKAGHLDARVDLSDTSGADRELLEGINEMLDAVIGPLNVATVSARETYPRTSRMIIRVILTRSRTT